MPVSLAEKACAQQGWDFAQTFRFQFRLSRQAWHPCKTWRSDRIGGWHLAHCPDLPRHDLILSDGTKAGVVLGVAVDGAGNLIAGPAQLPDGDTIATVQTYLERLAGRFVAIVSMNGDERVYFDPTGGLSAVYAPRERALASSVHVLLDREIIPEPGVAADAVLRREAQFLLGETCDAECRRIMANHYLDLATFELHRHWPREDATFDQAAQDRTEVAHRIAERLSDIVGALAAGHRSALPLSSGTDSRILLAAATPHLARIDRFYVHDIRWITRFDRQGAGLLAKEVGVDLEVIDRRDSAFAACMTDDQDDVLRRQMSLRTSLGFDGIDTPTRRAVSLTPDSFLVLRGNAAEMTRANKWTAQMARNGASVEDGLAALLNMRAEHLPERVAPARLSSLMARYAAWVESLPEGTRSRLPDMAHAEVFMPAAPNNVYYAFTRNFYLNPFNDRELLGLTAWFHPLARRRRRLVAKIIGRMNPALNRLPYLQDLKRAAKAG